jgi:23S rRNA (adenine2030-N6)-methyltransferase
MVIDKLKNKSSGFCYFDTHSGAGVYQLDSAESIKTNESQQGIERLYGLSFKDSQLNTYLSLVSEYKNFAQYPGSPEIAKSMLRPQDQMVLMELHNQEILRLKSNMGGKNIAIHHRDGYEGLVALTPPISQRGLVLIDPSYELAEEYQQVVDTVSNVYKRWKSGVYAIWYPLLSTRASANSSFESSESKQGKSQVMLEALSRLPFKNLLKVELCVTGKNKAEGMYGSGLAIINAPWKMDKQIENSLQELMPLMAQNQGASFEVDWLIQEQ